MNNTNIKKQIFLLFQDNRIQSHHPDNSILQWKNHQILYISPKGIKNTIALSQVHKLPDLYAKFLQGLKKLNMYSTLNTYFCNDAEMSEIEEESSKQKIKKSVKINDFRWFNPQVEETKDGYEVKSDCGFAKVVLKKDLYIVEGSYLQYMGVKKNYANKIPNMTKILLQKYNYQYSQFPINPQQEQKPEYFYLPRVKRFTIFNIPNQWKYPLHLIWTSLITYKVIPHRFCYIDFAEQEMMQKTPMPEPKILLHALMEQQIEGKGKNKQSDCTLPILGQINHKDECLFMKIHDCQAWFGQNWNIMADQFGFWFAQELVSYRKLNRIQRQHQYHPRALPCVLRLKNEPERSILNELKLFVTYKQENKKVSSIKKSEQGRQKSFMFDNKETLINQQTVAEVGNFKAFSNGIVIVKFVDRSMLTMNSKRMEVKIIKSTGDSSYVDLANTEGMSFQANKTYICHAVDFQERTFFPEQWLAKQEYSKRVRQALEDGEAMQKMSQIYLKL